MSLTSLDQQAKGRAPISRPALEDEIAKAVKTDEACEGFSGVIVESAYERTDCGANWRIKGIRFGTADRSKVASIVAAVVERMQQDYELSDVRISD